MKPLITATAALLLLSACEKKKCWQCTTNTYAPEPGHLRSNPIRTSTNNVCDMTVKEKEQYELVNSMTYSTRQNDKEVETSTITTCQ